MLSLTLTLAAAASPLIHEGDPAEATATAAARGGVDPASLEPVPFASLRGGPPALAAGGTVATCRTPGDVELALQKAEGVLLYGRFEEAGLRLEEARDAVLCASVDPPASTLARIELFAGLLAEERGDPQGARERYAAALGYDRAVPWPDSYPPERRALFDATAQAFAPPTVPLQVRPGHLPATIDGRPYSGEVAVGEHVVRVGGVAARVTLDEAPNRLVLPAAYPDDALGWIDDEARRPDLTALLAARLGEGTEVWVVDGDTAWRGVAGRSDWERLGPPADPADRADDREPAGPVAEDPPPRRSRAVPIAGVALGLLGAGLAGSGSLIANDAARDAEAAPDKATWEAELKPYNLGRNLWYVGVGLGGAGAVVGTVGWVLR